LVGDGQSGIDALNLNILPNLCLPVIRVLRDEKVHEPNEQQACDDSL
jgi:hypothetical protein